MNFPQRMSNGVSPTTTISSGPQIFPLHAASAREGGGGDMIAVFVIVGEPAKIEKFPQAHSGAA